MVVDADGDLPARTGVRYVHPRDFQPSDYDVVKTCYQHGFEALEQMGWLRRLASPQEWPTW